MRNFIPVGHDDASTQFREHLIQVLIRAHQASAGSLEISVGHVATGIMAAAQAYAEGYTAVANTRLDMIQASQIGLE